MLMQYEDLLTRVNEIKNFKITREIQRVRVPYILLFHVVINIYAAFGLPSFIVSSIYKMMIMI